MIPCGRAPIILQLLDPRSGCLPIWCVFQGPAGRQDVGRRLRQDAPANGERNEKEARSEEARTQ
jgi:hypothetical protein